jgi:hypothetical protein
VHCYCRSACTPPSWQRHGQALHQMPLDLPSGQRGDGGRQKCVLKRRESVTCRPLAYRHLNPYGRFSLNTVGFDPGPFTPTGTGGWPVNCGGWDGWDG